MNAVERAGLSVLEHLEAHRATCQTHTAPEPRPSTCALVDRILAGLFVVPPPRSTS